MGLDKEFLESLPDNVRSDVLSEFKNSQKLENDKKYTNTVSYTHLTLPTTEAV